MHVAKPIFDVSAQAYLADRVPYESRARYLGLFELTWAGGLLVGAPAAGWLIEAGGWTTPFWAIAGLIGLGMVLITRALEAEAPGRQIRGTPLQWDMMTGSFMAVVALFSGAAEVVFVVMGAWLEESFALSIVTLGGVATLIALAELAGEGGVAGFADRIGKRTTVALGMVTAAGGFLALAVFDESLGGGMAAMMVAYLGFEVSIVGSIPLASELRPGARARFLSWMVVAMAIGRTMGAATGTKVFVEFGVPGNALVAAVANLVALVLFLSVVREAANS